MITLPARGRPSRHRRTRASQRLPVSTDVFADPRTEWRCRFADGRHPHASGRAIPHRVLAKVDFLGLLAGFEALREKAFVLPPLVPTAIRSTGAYEIPGFATRALGSGKAAADKHQLSSTLNL